MFDSVGETGTVCSTLNFHFLLLLWRCYIQLRNKERPGSDIRKILACLNKEAPNAVLTG
jgi:hypothetical protein